MRGLRLVMGNWRCVVLVALISCADPEAVEVIGGTPVRIGSCHLAVEQAKVEDETKLVAVRYACGVDPEVLATDRWWGSRSPPLAFTMSPGDCLMLERTYYCLEEVVHQRSGTFRPRYKQVGGDLLEALPGRPR